jgi:hypothetical protein
MFTSSLVIFFFSLSFAHMIHVCICDSEAGVILFCFLLSSGTKIPN